MGSAERIKHVARLVNDGERKIVVLSAVAGTTNRLVEITKALHRREHTLVDEHLRALETSYEQLISDLLCTEHKRSEARQLLTKHWTHIRSFTLDSFTPLEERAVLAQGELMSTALMQLHLEEEGITSRLLPALDFMRIDQQGEPDMWYIQTNLDRMLEQHRDVPLFITQGYICRSHFGEVDNLKRGGSDYSASIIGAALHMAAARKHAAQEEHVSEVQIWTDIDGMHNNDPRVVKQTQPIERLTFEEAAELAYFGAKILHPSSILPARRADIPVVLKSTMAPERAGTIISNAPSGEFIKAVAAKDGITAIKIKSDRMLMAYGFLRKLFDVFERHRISIDMVTTSEVAVSLTIDHEGPIDTLLDELRGFGTVEVERNQTIVCIVGHLIQEEPGHAAHVFDALRGIPLRMISYGGSKNNVSLLIHTDHKEAALRALNQGLFKLDS